jgi:hypothetical protein
MPAPQPKKLSLLVLALSVVTAAAHAQQDAPAAEPAEGRRSSGFRIPLHDSNWNDATLVLYEFP